MLLRASVREREIERDREKECAKSCIVFRDRKGRSMMIIYYATLLHSP